MTTTLGTQEPTCGVIRLWGRLDVPLSTTQAAAIRMSDSDARSELQKLIDALGRQEAGSQVGVALSSLGPDITEESPEGERDRLIAGLVEVRLQDLDPRAANRLLAYAGVVMGVVVAIIPSTAIESDLPSHEGDRTHSPRNGANEFILEGIGSLPALEVLAVPRLDRLLRRVCFQGQVLDSLRAHDVRLLAEGGARDLMDSTQMALTSLEGATKGDGDAVAFKQKCIGGRIGALEPGQAEFSQRDFNYSACPVGYRAQWRNTPDGARLPIKGSIVLEVGDAPAIGAAWAMFAEGATRRAIGDAVAALGWPMRDGSGRRFADLSSKQRAAIMYATLTRGLSELHRTGNWRVERSTSAPTRVAGGRALTRGDDGRYRVSIDGRLPVQLVDGLAWGVSSDVWEKVAARFEREARETPKAYGGRWSTQLMHYSPPFWTGGAWHRFMKEHTTLQLRSIPGGSEQDPPAEWDDAFTTLVASCNFRLAWRRIGVELLSQLALAGAGAQELALIPGAETDTVRALRDDLSRTLLRSELAASAAVDAGDLAQTAQHGGNLAAAAAQLSRQDTCLIATREAGDWAVVLEGRLGAALAADVSEVADLRTPLGVGAALARWDGRQDLVLRSALEQLGIVATMRGRYNAATGEIELVAQAKIHLVDGAHVLLPLAVRFANTSNRRESGAEAPALVMAWANGATFEDLADKTGRTSFWARRTVADWFSAHRVDTMVTALLDCPILVTRQAVVATVAPELQRMPSRTSDGTKLTAATISTLVSPYVDDRGGAWKAWTGMAHASDRRMFAVLRAAGGEADVAAIEAAASADPVWLAKPFGNRPALATTPRFGRRRLRPCPHADCPNAWASHVLYVPETADYGCICPVCRRVPDLQYAEARLPVEYTIKWERTTVDGLLTTTRSTAAQLVLPDAKLARIAGELIRPLEVAQILGVRLPTVARLRKAGQLPSVECGKILFWRRPDVQALAHRRANSSTWAIKDGLLSPDQAAAQLGVPAHRVRQYCQDGLLAYSRLGAARSARIRIRPDVVAAFIPPPGDLIRALSVEELRRRTGLSRALILHAIESGELASVLPSSGFQRVMPEALTAWLSLRPQLPRISTPTPPVDVGVTRESYGQLSISAAAALLQLSTKQVRRLADQGVLNGHRAENDGWRWFNVDEVVALAATRKQS